MTNDKAIFFDEREQRWRRTRNVLAIVAAFASALLAIFAFAVFEGPELPPEPATTSHDDGLAVVAGGSSVGAPLKWLSHERGLSGKNAPLRLGFYLPDDPSSLRSLKEHHSQIDVLAPVLLHAVGRNGRATVSHDDALSEWLQENASPALMPVVDNFDGTTWRGADIAELLSTAESRRALVSDLEAFASENHSAGIVIDFEEIPAGAHNGLRQLARELAARLHGHGRRLLMAVPALDADYDYAELGRICDAIILMNYDQHWETSTPGPIAAQSWYATNLAKALRAIPAEKLIVGIANYAYDWVEDAGKAASRAESVTVQQALATAQSSASGLALDPASLNPHFSYIDAAKRTHRVWLLDAVTAHNQIQAAEGAGALGTALWRLGSEDPTFWPLWRHAADRDSTLRALQRVPPAESPEVVGDGDVWRITGAAQTGRRQIRRDPATGTIVEESFSSYPRPYQVEQQGGAPGKIALTFDDGPDPRFTAPVLDILRDRHVMATFFVTGIAAYQSPGLLERAYAEGHEIGNHTYTHTDLDKMTTSQLRLELMLTQRLIQSRLGVSTLLFRPPFGVDEEAVSPTGFERLRAVQQLGYRIVGSQIDANDWGHEQDEVPPSPDEIVETVLEQARNGDGHVVLMHDGGGDRQNTVTALPRIIDGLRGAGFELVPVSTLLGETRADAMPSLGSGGRWMARANAVVFDAFRMLRLVIAAVCFTAIALIGTRSLAVIVLAVLHKRRPKPPLTSGFRPLVSVLVPAYDEEKVILPTLESVLQSDYAPFEVIVIDDGSRDATGELVADRFAGDDRVRLLRQTNQGKSAALNRGVGEARGDILVTIDADTRIEPATISRLVRHFVHEDVAGVAGNTKVANRARRLARWQALEYISGQNLEKRAFDLLNCITVVPGAVGAWRASAIRASGGFSRNTVAEDTDLTLTIRKNGWRILFDDEAIARTIAPETSAALVRQRFRWTFGTLQALWKHRDAFGRERYGTLGRVALPHIVLFQIVLPLFCPVVDLLFFGSIALWALARAHLGPFLEFWTPGDVERALFFFTVFLLIDVVTSLVAFLLERDEEWGLLLSLPLQRFYYRQLMDIVLFRAILRAIQGRQVGWGRVGPRTFSPLPQTSQATG
jgi:cellulose synthase/poly-beta-1,6-N-acetylglucosamine synthase-like glycosyltransferase/peptidoglycan/xylan/chitin deacetylase (PgdA/CDA1 family)/spore germination protein YaaH